MVQETVKNIRIQLRRFMNGVVSDRMRRSGIIYKLNFGVSLPQLKEIASGYQPDKELAEYLWEQDVRELKILSFYLYPTAEFTEEKAQQWAENIKYMEIAEQFTLILLRHLPFAEKLATRWIDCPEEYIQACGFLLFSRICSQEQQITTESAKQLLEKSTQVLEKGLSGLQRTALTALKRYGRQSHEQAAEVLEFIKEYKTSGNPEKIEFYNDLKFEFDYSL